MVGRLAFALVALCATGGMCGCGERFESSPAITDGCMAMRFAGEQFVQIADAADLELATPFTIEARIFYDGRAEELHIVSHHDYGPQVGYQLGLHSQSIDFRIYTPERTLWQDGGLVTGGGWHHIAAVSDGEQSRLFLDGELVSDRSPLDGLWPADYAGPLRIGAAAYAPNFYFDGLIDEVRISRGLRYADTFDVPAGIFALDADTIALWHFDEPEGQSVEDATGAHTGTLGESASTEFVDPVREAGHCVEAIARPTG